MKITFNSDEKVLALVRASMLKKEGYCPCRIEKTPETMCMCEEFRNQIADPNFEGFCHCRLYYKSK